MSTDDVNRHSGASSIMRRPHLRKANDCREIALPCRVSVGGVAPLARRVMVQPPAVGSLGKRERAGHWHPSGVRLDCRDRVRLPKCRRSDSMPEARSARPQWQVRRIPLEGREVGEWFRLRGWSVDGGDLKALTPPSMRHLSATSPSDVCGTRRLRSHCPAHTGGSPRKTTRSSSTLRVVESSS